MQPPDELRDQGRATGWLNKLLRWSISTRLLPGIGYRLNQSHRGVSLEIMPGSGGGSTVKHYRIKSIEGDFLTCRTFGGDMHNTALDGTEDIYIARDPELRRSTYEGRTLAFSSDGDSFSASYTYTSNTKRTKTADGVAEVQVIIPLYKVDFTVITAAASANKTGVTDPDEADIYLVELTQRAWAKLE